MKTGNVILAVFFWYMAIELPIKVYELITEYTLQEYLPLEPLTLGLIIFGVFIILGCGSLVIGRDIKIKHSVKVQSTEDKVDDIFEKDIP